ncbi:hypothetical protein [Paenibacillus hexagrammi]|uniref:Uncharacterized protein n=1 Tax=Paenibacillus hexagrammi TaxID=2908839 RepID=A0ABY3SD01_9BACL|nr:hypothetical protein [Paenibacillus sp. YPD9-1]UJF31365.1 hypothetical protein L0M14_16135 [Paenibacillus sp. YPD9-1]
MLSSSRSFFNYSSDALNIRLDLRALAGLLFTSSGNFRNAGSCLLNGPSNLSKSGSCLSGCIISGFCSDYSLMCIVLDRFN